MRIPYKVCAFILFILVYPLSAVSFEGPLQIKNLYPIFLHTGQPYMEKASMENSIAFSLSHSSTYTVEESGHWTIGLDMEITELDFRYKKKIKDLFELSLNIPVLIFSAGFMDSFLGSYHDAFDFPDYGRSERPDNEFLYEVERDGALIVKGESGVGFGDVRIAFKRPLVSSYEYVLSIKGDIEIPVGNAKKGYGNGSIDAGLSLLFDKIISDRTMTYWNLGIVFPGDIKADKTLDPENFVYAGAAVETAWKKNLSLLAHVQWQTALYPVTGIPAVDKDVYVFVVGGRYNIGKRSFELSLTEDINTSGAPDFILNVAYKVEM